MCCAFLYNIYYLVKKIFGLCKYIFHVTYPYELILYKYKIFNTLSFYIYIQNCLEHFETEKIFSTKIFCTFRICL